MSNRERKPRDPDSKSPYYEPVAQDHRRSPENLERLKAQGFQPGHPHHGGRKPVPAILKQRLGDMADDAADVLFDLMKNSEKDAVRLAAVQLIISPFVSKAARKIEVSHEHSVSDLLRSVNDRLAGHKSAMIDVTPVEEEDNDDDTDDKWH
ncbi:hypothetical protein EXN32_21955 [Agrobacterium tumefaciens]|uniref:hypothetical protein n=1 Tax=Agrobacterium TaxID=357 RepID=UPI00115DE75D|nr:MULTISPECIES: hypothetical protein [Agrobacterium]MDA5241143.1 hypothetical protein [Agrobacterium sp. MAFF310724]MDA5249566.1 hypothetical protein [Agrobacterium sp. MAFF210268]TRB12371.1 hypothetical protein EXN32_21955 [Agrobacterium tumefaciens]